MTFAAAPALRNTPAVAEEWLPRITGHPRHRNRPAERNRPVPSVWL